MKIKTQLSFKDFLFCQYYVSAKFSIAIGIMAIGAISTIIVVIDMVMGDFSNFTFQDVVVPLLMLLGFPISIWWNSRRLFFSNPKLGKLNTYYFLPESFVAEGDGFKSEVQWNLIHKVIETKKWILIYPSPYLFHIIKKSDVGDDLTPLRHFLGKLDIDVKLRAD